MPDRETEDQARKDSSIGVIVVAIVLIVIFIVAVTL